MANTPELQADSPQPAIYKIRIKGHLDSQWADWFAGLTITLEENDETLLTGPVIDQAVLHGLLKRIRDLGMPLVSVCPVQSKKGQLSSKKGEKMNSIKKTARTTGLLYLIYIVFQALPTVIGSSKLVVNGDAVTTARNIMTSGGLFRMGYMVDLLAAAFFLLAAWALYVLLQRVNKNVALLFLLLNLGGVAIQCFSDLFLIGSQLLLSGADYLKAFQADQLQTMSMLFLNLHANGFMVAQLFFAIWLFPLGYLVFKSNYLPRILGVLLMVECFGWLMYPLQFFLFPSSVITYISSAIGFIGEFSLALWLLIMGAKDQKPALVEAE